MNIKEAKQEIQNTLRAYHRKDPEGRYIYPPVRQRPILLMGPPGIGKTAILEQAARECGVGLVAYTITHHTRQSAIGLPHIETKIYDGQAFSVTEYTLSEIIASVYDAMERTGQREGILFLDEINCVSETLAPTMLQLLQNKTFGSHKVPEGWMIVAAGNPPEYNKSVREFDVATLDRVRRIDVEADLDVWMEYAWTRQVHGAILSYLRIREDRFYAVEQQGGEKSFVTARGWEDLSELLKSYEALGIPVPADLAGQFLQKEDVAREFTAYYQLYRKYGADYDLPAILAGTAPDEAEKANMLKAAPFEERFTAVNLMLECLNGQFIRYVQEDRRTVRLHQALQALRHFPGGPAAFLEDRRHGLDVKPQAALLTPQEAADERWVLSRLDAYDLVLRSEHISAAEEGFERIKVLFQEDAARRAQTVAAVQAQLDRAFRFLTQCFGEGQEMILFISGLTRNEAAMTFISLHGCDAYLQRSEALLYRRREQALQEACQTLAL